MRISKDEYYLQIAEIVAKRSTCLRKNYGAVIVKNDEIIATGYNGAPRGCTDCLEQNFCYKDKCSIPADYRAALHGDKYGLCIAVHAEQNALLSAARKDLLGATLYLACLDSETVVAPCNVCDRLIRNAGIKRLVWKEGEICSKSYLQNL